MASSVPVVGGLGLSSGGAMAGNKRRLGLGAAEPTKKKKAAKSPGAAGGGEVLAKTPFMVLHEKYPLINQLIKWEQGTAPTKTPFFRCYVEVSRQSRHLIWLGRGAGTLFWDKETSSSVQIYATSLGA